MRGVDAKEPAGARRPGEFLDVKELCAARVGVIAAKLCSVREGPDHPRVDGTEAELAGARGLGGGRHALHDPGHLGGRVVGRERETRAIADALGRAVNPRDGVTHVLRARALPHDRVAEGVACARVPRNGGLALVGDADARNVGRVDALGLHHLARHGEHVGGDLGRVVAHPTALVHLLLVATVGAADKPARLVHQKGLGALCGLVDADDVATHGASSGNSFGTASF